MEKLGKTRATSLLLDKLGIPGLRYPASGKYSNSGSKGAVSAVFKPGRERYSYAKLVQMGLNFRAASPWASSVAALA